MRRVLDLYGQFSHTRWRSILIYLMFGSALLVGIIFLGDELVHHFTLLETQIAHLGVWGALVFVCVFIVMTSLLVPESVLSIMAGALFGFAWGLIAVVASNLLAAACQYLLSRYLLRSTVERVLAARPALLAIQRAVVRNDFKLQVLIRLTPLNPASISYVLGAAGVRFVSFMVACLAFFPHMAIEVYFGYAGRHAAHVAVRGSGELYLHDFVVLAGLAVTAFVVFLISKLAHRAVMEAVPETVGAGLAPD